MIKFLQKAALPLFLFIAIAASSDAFAQLATAAWPVSSPYSQNFNTTPGTAGTLYPNGWKAYQGTVLDTDMIVGSASSTTGGNYNFNSSVGLLASGSYAAPLYIVVNFASTAGKTDFKISYDVKKIREQGRNETFNLEISTTSATAGFTAVTGGTYDSGTLAEGNVKSYTNLNISGIDNKTGTVWLRWAYTEIGGSGSRDGMALDNVVISWTSAPIIPDAPVATAATDNNTGSSFTANWNAVTNATGYRLDVATDNLFANILEDYDGIAVSGTSKLVNIGILANETYYYRVRAERDAETSDNSNVMPVLVSPFILQPPVAVAATAPATGGFTANWNAVTGATGYFLDVSTSPDFATYNEVVITETFTNMGTAASAFANRTWTGDGGVAWTANAARTDWFTFGSTTDRILGLFENVTADDAYLISGPITGDFNYLSFDAWKVFNNGSHTVVTAYLLTGTAFENETILGTHATPTIITAKNTFSKTLPSIINGPYKIKIAVTENVVSTPANTARTGLDNIKFGTREMIAGLFVTGYNNLDAGNVTSYQVTGLEPGTTYYYRVRSYSATDTSGNSNVVSAATGCIVVTSPTASLQQFCGSAIVADLELAETNVHWYTVQTAGTELATTTALASGTYYASLFTGNCESVRVAVTVTVSNTTAPIVAPLAVCAGSTVANLTANGTGLKWYADAVAVTPLTPETALVAGNYYVTQTLNTCESPRAVVAVTITALPEAPVAAAQVFCGPSTVAQLMPAPVNGIAPITESFENSITGGITGSHNFATGSWNMQNGTTNTNPANSYTGNSIKFGVFHRYTSPAFNKIKTITFYARAETAKTLEVKKIVGAAETSLQIINLTTTMQQYTVQVNEVNDNVKIYFLGDQTSTNAYMDEVVFIFNDGTPQIKWYADETGGTSLAATVALATGDYFVSQIVNGCEGPRTEVEITINAIPDAPVAPAIVLCGTPTVAELSATGTALKWYTAQTGGNALAETETVTAGNYYVSQTVNNCESPRAEVAVTINPIPAAPVTAPLAFCGSATVAQLTVTTGSGLKWYTDETGGAAMAETDAITSDTYYVSQTVGTCESPRASVAITVNPVPDAPEAASLSFCGPTLASQLTATTGTGLKWYTTETGTTALTGTESIITGNYFVSQTVGGCESARATVAVTVNPIPAAPSITEVAQTYCSGATVASLLPDNASIKWYTASSNGTALADDAVLNSGLSVYYASQTVNGCESTARTAVAVMINVTAQPAANGNYTFCNSATAGNLTATGANIKWYASATATEAMANGDAVTTGTYYVTQTINDCESLRKAVAVTVNEVTPPAADPIVLCGASTVADLTATGTGLKWYVSNTSLDALAGNAAIITGTYYVSQSAGTCESSRTAVSVTVNSTPALTVSPLTFCTSATAADLTATGTDIKWYASLTAAAEMDDATPLATGTYYVTQTLNDCESIRAAVSVSVNNMTAPTADVFTFCNSATIAELTATGTGLRWYETETSTTILASTATLSTGTYYVSQSAGTCESSRTPVLVTVNNTTPLTVSPLAFCNSATSADLTATGTDVKWYASLTAAAEMDDATPLATGTYYVTQTLNNCESVRAAVAITVNVITVTGAATQEFDAGQTLADLEVTGNGTGIVWYNEETLTDVLPLTTVLSDGHTYYAVAISGDCESEPLAVTADDLLSAGGFNVAKLQYYPNPVKDMLTISYTNNISTVQVYNLLGQAVLSQAPDKAALQLDMSALASGTYIVKLTSGNNAQTFKVVKN